MKINPVNNVNFKQVVETFMKDKEENQDKDEDKDVYETTITWTETIKVPKSDKTLQKVDYMV